MSATVAFLIPPAELELAAGDRFELTPTMRPKLRPCGPACGVILADADDCWKVRFDGQSFSRVVCKRFIRPERRQ